MRTPSLALPFMGLWTVSQGVSGAYTHRGIWRHALDFIVVKQGRSFAGQGQHLEDFYAYGLPVLSPAFGQVWRVVNDVPDNVPIDPTVPVKLDVVKLFVVVFV